MKKTLFTSAFVTLLAMSLPQNLNAATRTWTGGGGDADWATPENWGGTAPANGDVLVFSGTTRLSNTNTLVNLSVAGLRFESGGFQLHGNPINLTTTAAGLVTNLAGVNTIYLGLSPLQSNKRWEIAPGSELILAGTNTSSTTGGGIVMLDGNGTVRFTGRTTAIRGMDVTNGTVIVDGGFVEHSNDGFRAKATVGSTATARLINNGTWRWGGGANFRLGNSAAAGVSQMFLESGTLELYGAAVSIFVGDNAVAGSSSVFNQNGGTVLSTGTGNNDLILGTASGAQSVYNLNAGVLMLRRVRANVTGQGVLNFNGGVLMAKVNDALFIDGLAGAYIKSGGAIIDSSSNTVTIAQGLQEDFTSPGGGLTKLGSGSLTLAGANSYSGPTRIGEGAFGLTAGNYPANSALTLSNSTTLNLDVSGGGGSLATPGLTLDDNVTLNLNYGTLSANPGLPAVSDVTTAGTVLTARGTGIVFNVSGSGFVKGQFTLIKYSGAIGGNGYPALALGALPPGVLGRLVHNTANASIDLEITLVVNALTWNGNLSANWDINTTANWKDALGTAAGYKEYGTTDIVGDVVTFNDNLFNDLINPPRTNINLTTTLYPAVVEVSGFSTPYSFAGPGKLSGAGLLNVSGFGSLTIRTANDYTGGSRLSGGMVHLGHDQALGVGPLTLAGGSLSSDSATARVVTNAVKIDTTATFLLGDGLAAGPLNFTGPVDFLGSGNRNLTCNADVTFSGSLINGGIGDKNGLGTLTLSDVTANLIGDFELRNGTAVFANSAISKSQGGVRLMCDQPSSASILTIGSGSSLLMSGPGQNIRVGSTGPAGDVSSTNIINVAGTLAWTTNASSFGQVQMGASCAFAQVNLISGGLIQPGMFAHQGNISELNLDGGTLAPTYSTPTYLQGLTAANVRSGGVTVNTEGLLGEPLNITIAQALLNGGGGGGLTKAGAGTLVLAGTNTYAGPTVVSGGTLLVGPGHAGPGNIVVADGATLGCWSDAAGVTVQLPSVSLGNTTGATLLAYFTGRSGNPTVPAAHIGNLTLNTTVPVSVTLGGIQAGTIPLVRYTTLGGVGEVTTGALPQGVAGVVTNNTATKTIELVVTGVTPLVWTAAGGGNWDVGISTNWALGGEAKAFLDGDNVVLDDSAASTSILITQPVSPGSVMFNNTAAAYALLASGTGKLSGSTGITKDGTNVLVLGGANDFTGDVVVKSGILQLDNVAALGSTVGATYVSNGATLNLQGRVLANAEIIQIIGNGYAGLGALYSDGGTANADYFRDLRLAGDASIGTATGNRYGFTAENVATLTCVGGLHKLTKVGGGQFDLEDAAVTVGDIDVQAGVLQVSQVTTINPGYPIAVQAGAEFRIYRLAAPLVRPFTLNGGQINVTGWAAVGQNQLDGEITLVSAGTFLIGGGFEAVAVKPVQGSGNLIKTGAGVLALMAVNPYTGQTVVSNGTLSLSFGAAIAATPSIFVNNGATLDVSALAPWTLAANQSLSGNGTISGSVVANGSVSPGALIGTLTFGSDLTLSGTSVMEISRDGGLTNDMISVGGLLTCGGTLQIAVTGTTPLAVGDTVDLFNWTGGVAGSFNLMLPAEYSWDVSQLTVDGTIRVTGVKTRPTLSVVQVGNTLQFTWTGAGYKLQAQTNTLSVGLSGNWGDYPGGNASPVTVPIDAANGTVYFRLSTP